MSKRGRRGCLWLLGVFLIVTILAGLGLANSARQISAGGLIPLGRGYIAMGRIVKDSDCRYELIAGFVDTCPRRYGATIYLPQLGRTSEITLITIPDSWVR
jgi:hypothetical protein